MAKRKKTRKKTRVSRKKRVLSQAGRIRRITLVFGLCMAMAICTILYTMITGRHLWSGRLALNAALRSSVLTRKVNGVRGEILDRNGQVLAQQTVAYNLYANFDTRTPQQKEDEEALTQALRQNALDKARQDGRTQQVEGALAAADSQLVDQYVQDPAAFAKALKSVLGDQVDENTLTELVKKGKSEGKAQIALGLGTFGVSRENKERLEAMKIPGLSFEETVTREYPTTPMSSHLIGFAAYDDQLQNITGKIGLESSMESYLGAKNGLIEYQATSLNQVLPGTEVHISDAANGDNVKLTIDESLQQTVEKAVQQTMTENNATDAWALVMDPETGRILAWASYPSFDQNTHRDIEDFRDRISQNPIEPGSVIKPLIYSMAVDAGVFPWNTYYRAGAFAYSSDPLTQKITRVEDNGTYPVIYDAMKNDYGTLTFEQGLAHSSNIAICELLANHLNKEQVSDYLKAYKLFDPTYIPYASEYTGTMNLKSPSDYLSTGFGQASSMTMLELAQAYTAIFNDGIMMKPYVVDSIIDGDTGKTLQKFNPEVSGLPISANSAKSVREMMQGVMAPGMTGERFAIDGVDMALKTGTGEIYNPETGTYDAKKYTSSVVAAAPASDPKVMVLWGMQSENFLEYSAQPFQTIMSAALKTANVNTGTDRSVTEAYDEWNSYEMPALSSHSRQYAEEKMADKQVNTVIIGDGDSIIGQFPAAGTTINSNDNILLLTNGAQRTMPDTIGWTRKDLTAFWQLTGIPFTSNGFGRVVWQSIEAGTPINTDTQFEVRLE